MLTIVSEHFSKKELSCPCCGLFILNETLLFILECLREFFGNKPITVNSGCRCAYHNIVVNGKKGSKHLTGEAADIVVEGVSASKVADILEDWFPDSCGIGRYYTFTHFDIRDERARW